MALGKGEWWVVSSESEEKAGARSWHLSVRSRLSTGARGGRFAGDFGGGALEGIAICFCGGIDSG
jgi:hypothetical protein